MSLLNNGINDRLYYTLGKRPDNASKHDFYMALCYAVRDQMMSYWLNNQQSNEKEVAYLSEEFLIEFHFKPKRNDKLFFIKGFTSETLSPGKKLSSFPTE